MGKASRAPARLSVLAAALAVSLLAPPASAQNAKDLARARERFKEAAALQAAGDFARALEGYKDVALVKSTAQLRFNIATCEEKLGDYIRAVGSYRLALTEATRSNAKDIEGAVQKALADLEPRIPMLQVRRGEGAAVAEVTLDGRALANPSIGAEFQVNPGPHAVRAVAPDRLPFTFDVTLADRDHRVVTLVLKPKPAPVVAAVPVVVVEPLPEPPPPTGNRSLRAAGFVVGSLGVAGLAVAGAFFGLRQKAIGDLDAACGPTRMTCPSSAQSTLDGGKRDATIATAAFAGGLGLAAIGGILIGVSTRSKAPKPAAGLVFTPGGGAIQGAF
jgi:tetratricopeptide (TPR) repeat protein